MVASLAFVACGDDDSDDFFGKSAFEDAFGECDEDDDECSSSSRADGSSDSSDDDSDDVSSGSSSAKNGSSSSSGANSAGSSSGANSAGSSSGNGASSSSIPKDTIKVGFNDKYKVSISADSAEDYYTDYQYKTVQIGAYEWMAENLRTTGNISYCYDSDSTNCDTYGRLYYTNVPSCPSGFELPTKEQWEELFAIAKGTAALKSKSLWKSGKAAAGTNELGFNALPAGSGYYPGDYSGLGTQAKFMIAYGDGYYSFTNDSDEPVYDSEYESKKYVSIRCVKLADEVASEKELPAKCSRGETIIAAAKKYACSDTAWVRSVGVGDTCYTNEELMLAMAGSSRAVCKSGNWYKVTDLEDSLGYCDSKHTGDTITYQGTLYGCSDLNWHKAKLVDIYGECLKHETSKPVVHNGYEFICVDSAWTILTANDSLFGLCNDAMEGYIASGENGKEFICRKHAWKTATRDDILGACGDANYGEVKEAFGNKYICKSYWTTPTTLESRYGGCTTEREGVIIDSTTSYVCKNKTWTRASLSDLQGTCNKDNETESKNINGTLYVCRSGTWKTATTLEKTYGVCTKDKQGDHTESGYVCDNLTWREMTAEEFFGSCTAALQDTVFNKQMCDDGTWRKMNSSEASRGEFCRAANDGKLNGYYECIDKVWTYLETQDYKLGGKCREIRVGKTGVYNDTTYECKYNSNTKRYLWVSSGVNATLGKCNGETAGTAKTYKSKKYFCKATNHSASASYFWDVAQTDCEKAIGYCTRDKFGTLKAYNEVLMLCKKGVWEEATKTNYLGDCTSDRAGESMTFYDQKYVCEGDGMGWKPVYGSFTDTRDGHKYRTVGVGNRLWLADNLAYESSGSICANGKSACDSYGRLYTWEAAQSVCPEGWRLPSFAKDQSSLGMTNMMSLDGWQSSEYDEQTQYPDLDVKPSGIWRGGSVQFDHRAGAFWLSDEADNASQGISECLAITHAASGACTRYFEYDYDIPYSAQINLSTNPKTDGLGVRCVKELL